jgi:hypothetical protein
LHEKEVASPEAMAKYDRAAMMVMRVVTTWYKRRETGTFHDRKANMAEAITKTTKTTQRVRWPYSEAT